MKKYGVVVLFILSSFIARSQNSFKIIVRSEETKELLPGASVIIPSLHKGASTDSLGVAVFNDLPNGNLEIEISFIGYASKKQKINLPLAKKLIEIELESNNYEDNPDVVITATRTDRTIRNTPTRVEVIAGGEIGENVSMRPGEIKMLLNETTGIITQQTSAISNTANIRIQELDGRYTQILRDGFPLYSGLSEGLSLVQIPPLDLKQVEIIKGSSSTLYGGGAIAGLINLVSKTPTDKREISFLANATSAKGIDLSGFYSEKNKKAGVTVFASRNSGSAYDPSNIGFTAIPKFERYTFTPHLFLYGHKTNAAIGFGYTTENRLGGSINYVKHGTPGYFEKNISDRFTTQASVEHRFNNYSLLTLKNSYNHFNRSIQIPLYQFKGIQQSSFTELSWSGGSKKSLWVIGGNIYTDDFKEKDHPADSLRNYHYNTFGSFIQNTLSPNENISVETGVRGDYTSPHGFIFLPRTSVLIKISDEFSSRIGGGFGYKIPTIFTEKSEEHQFQNIVSINKQATNYERSIGGNIDFTFRTTVDEIKLSLNPLFFYTRINHPLVLQNLLNGYKQFVNANGYTDSKGIDLSIRIIVDKFKFFTGYSYTIAQNHFDGIKSFYPLSPRHRLHFDLVYEVENKLRIAFESYYTGRQQLSDGSFGRGYWLLGALVEKTWKHFSLFINSEDLNDARQAKWDSIYTGSISNPDFKEIYAPLEGITINGGVKIKL